MFRGFSIDDQTRIAEDAERYVATRRDGIGTSGLGLCSSQSKLSSLKARVRSRERNPSSSSDWIRDDMKNAKYVFKADEKALTRDDTKISADYHMQHQRNRVIKEMVESEQSTLKMASDILEQDKKRLKTSSDENHYNAIFVPTGFRATLSTGNFHDEVIFKTKKEKEEEEEEEKKKKKEQIDAADGTINVPLYKKLKKGDLILAKYAADGKWYRARVLSAIQKGYINCKYDIKFEDYGNIETICWQDAEELTDHIHEIEEEASEPKGRDYQSSKTSSCSQGDKSGGGGEECKDVFGRDIIRRTEHSGNTETSSCMDTLEKSVLERNSDGNEKRKKSRFDIPPTTEYRHETERIRDTPHLHEMIEKKSTIKVGAASDMGAANTAAAAATVEDRPLTANELVNPNLLTRKSGGWRSK